MLLHNVLAQQGVASMPLNWLGTLFRRLIILPSAYTT